MKKQPIVLSLLTLLLSLGMAFFSYAEEKTITNIPLSFSYEKAPKGGELVDTITADSSNSQFVVEGAFYLKQDDTWIFGEEPIVEVDLSAVPDFRFTSASKNYFSISGCNAQYKTAWIEKDGNGLTLQVTLPKIDGTLPATTAAGWSGETAVWDEVPGCRGYEVRIYRDDMLLSTETAAKASLDLDPFINNAGRYTYSVRPTGTYSTQAGPWYTEPEGITVTKEEAWINADGQWKQTGSRWRYIYENNAYPVNDWRFIKDAWYYFDGNGYMVSNCYVRSADGKIYYWIGEDGKWDTSWDTDQPNRAKYGVY